VSQPTGESSQAGRNFCPACGEPITADHMNLAEGVALCPACGQLSRLSEIVEVTRSLTEVLVKPPTGCWVGESGDGILVRATLRSLGQFAAALFITLFWNGIVSVFVLIAAVGLYNNFIGPVPQWFPAPHMEGDMPLGMTLFLCVFLIPFVVAGAAMFGATILCAVGRVEVSLGETTAVVRSGVGWLSWPQRFDPAQVRRVSTGESTWQSDGQAQKLIAIEADRTVKFGTILTDERREWMRAVLHVLLAARTAQLRREALAIIRNHFGQDAIPADNRLERPWADPQRMS
jgi:hypothetical protein